MARDVALCGSELNPERASEIQFVARNAPVLIALDPDAAKKAFYMAREFGPAFRSCRVVLLPTDPKDSLDLGYHLRRYI